MDDDIFNTGWDPHQELLTCRANIHQLAAAFNQQKVYVDKLIKSHNQHDEALLDISQQHRQLIDLLRQTRAEVARLKYEIEVLKTNQKSL